MLPLSSHAESIQTLAPPQLRGFRRLCTTQLLELILCKAEVMPLKTIDKVYRNMIGY